MPITILDYTKSVIGEKDTYTAEDFHSAGVEMIGGCQGCNATLAAYNAYPSKSGYWRCAGCIGDTGFPTVADFVNSDTEAVTSETDLAAEHRARSLHCPACGAVENVRADTFEDTFECGDCGAVWLI
ncbi:MAG TPA: hypothetical protein VGS19_36125 [Streptosporangiaceae bacterium]|nr:hypothetical protein [Streptosporangiaceae bacterium]